MKKYRNSFFVFLCIFCIFLSCGIADSFGDCCMDPNGKCYSNDAALDSRCYQKDETSDKYVESGKKLSDFIKNEPEKKTEVSQPESSPVVNVPVETKETSVEKPAEETKEPKNTVVNNVPDSEPVKGNESTQTQSESPAPVEEASNNNQEEQAPNAELPVEETANEGDPSNGLFKLVPEAAGVPVELADGIEEETSETDGTTTEKETPESVNETAEETSETDGTTTETETPESESMNETAEATPATEEEIVETAAPESESVTETAEVTPEPDGEAIETAEPEGTSENILSAAEPDQNGSESSGNETKIITISAPGSEINLPSEAVLTWDNPYYFDENTAIPYTLDYEIDGQKGSESVNCSSQTCSFDLSAKLGDKTEAAVVWSVTSSDGTKAEASFSLKPLLLSAPVLLAATPTPIPQPPLVAPVQECPKGDYKTEQLGFYWAPAANADNSTIYTVEWQGKSGKNGTLTLNNSDQTCQNGRCIVYGTLPGPDDYSWTVTASNSTGSATSGSMSFTILRKIKTPKAYRPAYEITNRQFTLFEWEDVRDVDEFRIQVVDYWTGCIRLDRWYEPDCQNGVCYVQPDCFLPSGDYSWRVQGRNKNFTSHWSNWRDFSVACDYCYVGSGVTYSNPVPYVSYPVGTITVLDPNYQWAAITGAYSYSFQLYDSSGKLILDESPSPSLCTTELCTFDPHFTLPGNDVYTWKIAAYGYNGVNWGSSTGAFTVETDTVETMAFEFLYPLENGFLDETNPLIIWSDPGNVAIYGLEIKGSDGTSLFTTALTPETAWCDGQTCSIEFDSIPNGTDYQITLTPYTDYNNPGTPLTLTFNKGAKPIELNSPKAGAIVSTRPLFRWNVEYETVPSDEDPAVPVEKSLSYSLYLTDSSGVQNVVSPLICGESGVNCENDEAFFSPAFDLIPGTWNAILAKADEPLVGEGISFEVK